MEIRDNTVPGLGAGPNPESQTAFPFSERLPTHRLCGSLGAVLLLWMTLMLPGCGGTTPTPIVTPPAPTPLLTSTMSGGTTTKPVARASANAGLPGSNIGVNGCTLTAGSAVMNYTANSGATWFTVGPAFGTLQPNTSTTISFTSINATALQSTTTNAVTISASGYSDNTQMSLTWAQQQDASVVLLTTKCN